MKRAALLLGLSITFAAAGCGKSGAADRDTIRIEKDGSIVETIRETFEEEYYHVDELESYITDAVDAYNQDLTTAGITFDKCSLKKNIVEAVLTYSSVEDYVVFNNKEIFVGSLEELESSDYHDSVNLKDRKGNTVSLSHVIASGEYYNAAVVTQDCEFVVSGKIIYASEAVEIHSGKRADITLEDEACAYIIYK